MKILAISVCDDDVDLIGTMICGIKLLEKRLSRNSAVPPFRLYFMRLKLKSLVKNVALPSAFIFDRSGSRYLLLNLYGFTDGCLCMVPSNELDLFGIIISMKIDSNSFRKYI